MKISTRVRYAVRLMMDIACHEAPNGEPVQLSQVAERNKLSKGYLEQLAVSLKNAQLIRSSSGRTGGYRLARSSEEISLLEIFEAAGGPVNVVECVGHPEDCIQSEYCRCRGLWELINLRITGVLADYSLRDLFQRDGVKRMSKELDLSRGMKGRKSSTALDQGKRGRVPTTAPRR